MLKFYSRGRGQSHTDPIQNILTLFVDFNRIYITLNIFKKREKKIFVLLRNKQND